MPSINTIKLDLNEGLDRKVLKTLKQRFLQVNRDRLQRVHDSLLHNQQIFLDILPLLFQVNHPLLPGYVSHNTPSGISDYTPTKLSLDCAKQLTRSFQFKKRAGLRRDIHSLFLMGSAGTVAHSTASDFDVWVCHRPNITKELLTELELKCQHISSWASSLGLETHFYLMDPVQFIKGQRITLSGEDRGNTQHYLLLDEFYRTALLGAGRHPIWWMIPANHENNYQEFSYTLSHKRFIRSSDVIDFGGIDHFPPEEFLGAGLWQLSKGIDSPYKSALKLLLTEVYASEHPKARGLSLDFKQAIYNNILDPDELDPYVLLYRRLEKYCKNQNEPERLELIRRCFYFKVNEKLSRATVHTKSWRRLLMEKLVAEWQWGDEQLVEMDCRKNWKISRVRQEQKELINELTFGYRFLASFAKQNTLGQPSNSKDMQLLGRKLHAAFERKAGKIELISHHVGPNLSEEQLTFSLLEPDKNQIDDKSIAEPTWAVYSDNLKTGEENNFEPLKRSRSLIELIAWAYLNRLLTNATLTSVHPGSSAITAHEFQSIVYSFQQLINVPIESIPQEDLERSSTPVHVILFVNVGYDPLEEFSKKNMHKISAQNDSLRFGSFRDNLIMTIDKITINSWHEIIYSRYEQMDAVIQCLQSHMQTVSPSSRHSLPKLDIRCFCPNRPSAITMRVEELFRDVIACYYSGTRPIHSRYVLEIEHNFYVLQYQNDQCHVDNVGNENNLLKYLSKNQKEFSPIVLDKHTLQYSPLAVICQTITPMSVQIFYKIKPKTIDIYIADECGSLLSYSLPKYHEDIVLDHLHQFIHACFHRQNIHTSPASALNYNVQIYTVHQKTTRSVANITPYHLKDHSLTDKFFKIQALASQDSLHHINFTVICDDNEFSEEEYGDKFYKTIAQYILDKRASHERYPCYITDLDLSQCSAANSEGLGLQTVDYISYKQQLEQSINKELAIL